MIIEYHKDIQYKVLKRLYNTKKIVEDYLKRNVSYEDMISDLDLDHRNSDLRHPLLDYTEEEKKAFILLCGEPLRVPKDLLTSVSPIDFVKTVDERIEFFYFNNFFVFVEVNCPDGKEDKEHM